uniref:Acetyltransferase n=1 Tax=Heterorhabditis bacteriophora TaxID=37862 RepID=A0A1I7XEV0_HETBA
MHSVQKNWLMTGELWARTRGCRLEYFKNGIYTEMIDYRLHR